MGWWCSFFCCREGTVTLAGLPLLELAASCLTGSKVVRLILVDSQCSSTACRAVPCEAGLGFGRIPPITKSKSTPGWEMEQAGDWTRVRQWKGYELFQAL